MTATFTPDTFNWPPDSIVKKNKRAKRVLIKPTRKLTLEITVPARFSLKQLREVIDDHKTWILNQFQKLSSHDHTSLPTNIHLQAFQKTWPVRYIESACRQICYENPASEIVLMGANQPDICHVLLRKFILRLAKKLLLKELACVSLKTGLKYESASVRLQKSRWGSCSHDNSISLNAKMIFFPLHLIHHVLIHELSHTVHHDHSEAFWRLVEKHDQHVKENKLALKKADCYIPVWLD